MSQTPGARPVRVLESYPTPRPHSNPYTALLTQSLVGEPDIELDLFTWKAALLAPHDVFHVHWPETRLRASTPLKSLVVQALYALLLLRLKVTRAAIVRTVHNLELPDGISRRERFLLRLTDRVTTLRIVLNSSTELPDDQPFALVPHGHYRDWYAAHPRADAVPGRVGFVGLVRRYKGVDTLIEAFRSTTDPGLTLSVGGNPSTPELADGLRALADGDPRITLVLRQLTDDEFVEVLMASQLIALPYREMHNSAGALTALSLGRPVLVPRNTVNERLADEVGAAWVAMYEGDLDTADVEAALAQVAAIPAGTQPDLSAREWSLCGPAHLAAFRRALRIRRG